MLHVWIPSVVLYASAILALSFPILVDFLNVWILTNVILALQIVPYRIADLKVNHKMNWAMKHFWYIYISQANEVCLRWQSLVKASCTNTFGSYTCGCNAGYVGDGALCVDQNECSLAIHTCGSNSNCINTPGSYNCNCNSGFTINSVSGLCGDTNECFTGTHQCHSQGYFCYSKEIIQTLNLRNMINL